MKLLIGDSSSTPDPLFHPRVTLPPDKLLSIASGLSPFLPPGYPTFLPLGYPPLSPSMFPPGELLLKPYSVHPNMN